MAGRNQLARNVALVTASRLVGLVFTFITAKLTVTHLGVHDYGLLTTAILFTATFGAFTELGVGNVVVRRVAGRRMDLTRQVGLSLTISAVIAIPLGITVMAVGLWAYGAGSTITQGISILTVALLATTWSSCYTPVAQVTGRFGFYSAADIGGRALGMLVVIAAIYFDGGITWFFLGQLIIPIGQLVAILALARSVGRFRPVWNTGELLSLVRETLPMTFILIVGVLYFTSAGLILSHLSTAIFVGAYGFAYKLIGNATVMAKALSDVLLPRLSSDILKSQEQFARTTANSTRIMLILAVAMPALVHPVSESLIRLAGSDEMVAPANDVVQLLSLAVAIGWLNSLMSTALIAAHCQRVLTRLNVLWLVTNIALNLVLVPRYNATGAGIALVTTELLGFIACLLVMTHKFPGSFPWGAIPRLALAAGSVTVSASLLHLDWVTSSLVCATLYACVVLVTRVTTIVELRGFLVSSPKEATL